MKNFIMKIKKRDNAISHWFPWKIERVTMTGFFLCAFVVVGYCAWTLDRGFEITDESYYLLLSMYSGSVEVFISAQQWITAGLWFLTGNMAMFRASGMFLLLSSAVLLALGVFSTCLRFGLAQERFVFKGIVIAGSVVCSMLYASTINLSPCYNLLASAGAYAAAGMVLLAMNSSRFTYRYTLFVFAGGAVGVETLSKPSAGITTLIILIFWLAIFDRSWINKFFGLVAIVFGTVMCVGIAVLVNTSMPDATQAFEQGLQLFRMVQVETIGARLVRYVTEFWEYFWGILKAFFIPIVALAVYAKTRKIIFVKLGLVALVLTLLFGNFHGGFSIHNQLFDSYLFGSFRRYDSQIAAIFALLLMAMIVSFPVWSQSRSTLVLFIGLILLPYSVAIGTGNALFTQVIDSLAPWGVLVAVLVVVPQPKNFSKMPTALIGICFIVTVALQIVTSSLQPYHLSASLIKQDQIATVGSLGEVKVDTGTYKFITEMKAAVKECDIPPGSPFLGLYNIPGVALALQATPVLTPWLNNKTQAEFVLEHVPPEGLNSAIVAFQMASNGIFPLLPQQLAAFPLGYRYCGTATYPYKQQNIQIWQSLER